MTGSLGQLIVEITTDLTTLNKGLADAEKKVRDSTGKITELTNKAGLAMTAMGAAITGALALMVKSTVDYSEEIYQMSQRTGIAVETLSELKYVAEQTETSFENMSIAVRFLGRNMYDATSGNYKMSEAFRTLGVDITDANGKLISVDQVFLKIADKFASIEDGAAKTALAIQIFGRSGAGIIPVLNLGSEGIAKLSQKAHELGIVLTAENAKAIDQFSDDAKSLQAALGGLWLNLSLLLMPALEKLVKFLTDAAVWIRKFSEEHPVLIKNMLALVGVFGVLMLAIGPLLIAIPPLITMFVALDVAAAPIIGTVLIIAAAVGVLTLAVVNAKAIWAGFMKFLEPAREFWFGKKPEAATANVDLGKVEVKKPASMLDETVNLVEKHAQKLKELNEQYLVGKINAQQYYDAIKTLHQDGLDIKQQELDLLNKSIDMKRLSTDAEYQRIYVMGQGIQTAQEYANVKAEMANQDLVDQQTSLAAATNLLQTLQSMHKTIWQGIFDFVNMGIKTFSSGMSTAISSIILGAKTASEAFKDFGMMMIEAIVNFVVQWAVQALIAATIGAGLTAAITAQASVLASAWLPAAIFASIATLGGADAAGAAGLAAAGASSLATLAALKAASLAMSPMAEGGSGIVDKPTLFLAGEAGPEAYNFSPLGKGGPGGVSIHIENVTVASEGMSIEDLAEQLGIDIERKLKRV